MSLRWAPGQESSQFCSRTPRSCSLPFPALSLRHCSPEVLKQGLNQQVAFHSRAAWGGWSPALSNSGFSLASPECGGSITSSPWLHQGPSNTHSSLPGVGSCSHTLLVLPAEGSDPWAAPQGPAGLPHLGAMALPSITVPTGWDVRSKRSHNGRFPPDLGKSGWEGFKSGHQK